MGGVLSQEEIDQLVADLLGVENDWSRRMKKYEGVYLTDEELKTLGVGRETICWALSSDWMKLFF